MQRTGIILFLILTILPLPFLFSQPVQAGDDVKQNVQVTNVELLKSELAELTLDNPARDVDRNLKRGDTRCVAVCGEGCYCPGLEGYPWGDSRMIMGTADVIWSKEQGELQYKAEKYAEEYNRILIKKLNSRISIKKLNSK